MSDSTSTIRYLVLPQRPAGTENWSEEELASLVTRDAMIGVFNNRLTNEESAMTSSEESRQAFAK